MVGLSAINGDQRLLKSCSRDITRIHALRGADQTGLSGRCEYTVHTREVYDVL